MELQPIGVVHSSVADPDQMPFEGVSARLELYPRFQKGLEGIAGGTHIVVIGWLHLASREPLQMARTRQGTHEPRGVFGLRSSHRPNPLSLTTCKLERVEGSSLYVQRLDLIDGTPIIDIKRYSPSWDCIFSARSSRDLGFPARADRQAVLDGMLVEAANFHGEECVGVALGVRMLYYAMMEWQVAQKDPEVVVHMGSDGCIADALQGLTGATLGNGRMKVPSGRAFRLAYGQKRVLAFQPKDLPDGFGVQDVLGAEIDDLFAVRGDVYAEGVGPHGGRPPKRIPPLEKQAMLLEGVQRSLVEGRLPCAAAHRLASELGVSVSDVGWAADESGVRITGCQLGCFK